MDKILMNGIDIKSVLYEKLHDEGCYFKKSDISVRKIANCFRITIKDYEHIPFRVCVDNVDCIGKYIAVERMDVGSIVTFVNGADDCRMREVLLILGYYISCRF